MSPRRTQLLHETRDQAHFGSVGLISLQGGDLGRQGLPSPQSGRLVHQRRPNGLGPCQALSLQLMQGPQ